MSGIVPNTLDSELNPPGRETTIVGNLVIDNNNYEAPTNRFGVVAKGMGIVVPGRVGDIIEKIWLLTTTGMASSQVQCWMLIYIFHNM